jgi:hypothetical protein
MGRDDGSQNRNGRDWYRIQWEPVGPEKGTIGAVMREEKLGVIMGSMGLNGNDGARMGTMEPEWKP